MAKQNSVNLDITNLGDGFDISGGEIERKLTVTAGDVTVLGGVSAVMSFPSVSTVVAGLSLAQTFVGLQTFSQGISAAGVTSSGRLDSFGLANLRSGISAAGGVTLQNTLWVGQTASFIGPIVAPNVVNKIIPGTAISVNPSGGTGDVTITNTGVTQAIAGAAISLSGQTGTVTITNTGVTGIVNSTTNGGTYGIRVNQINGSVLITNTGVTQAIAGSGISVSGATGTVTITNTGVLSAVTGTNITISPGSGVGNVTIGVVNNPTFSGLVTANSLLVQTNAIVNGNLGVTGSTDILGNLDVVGNISGDGGLNIAQSGYIGQQGTVNGDFTVNGTNTIINSTNVRIKDPVPTIGWTEADTSPPDCSDADTKDRGLHYWWTTGCTLNTFTTEVVNWGERSFNGAITGLYAIVGGITQSFLGPLQGYFGFNRAYKTFISLINANTNGTGAGGSGGGGAEKFSGELSTGWFKGILLGVGGSGGTVGAEYNYTTAPRAIITPPPIEGQRFSVFNLSHGQGGTLAHAQNPVARYYPGGQNGEDCPQVLTYLGEHLINNYGLTGPNFRWESFYHLMGLDDQCTACSYNGDCGEYQCTSGDCDLGCSSTNPDCATFCQNLCNSGGGGGNPGGGAAGILKSTSLGYTSDAMFIVGPSGPRWEKTNKWLADIQSRNTLVFSSNTARLTTGKRAAADQIELTPVIGTIAASNQGLVDGNLAFTYIRDNTVASINGLTGAVTNLCATRVDATGTNANAEFYPLFAAGTGCTLVSLDPDATHFRYNPSTGVLTALGISTSGLTLTGNFSASNIVNSFNGATGAVEGVSRVIVQSGSGVNSITGAFGLSAGSNITFSVSGQTLTISSAGGAGSSPAGANGYVQYFKDGSFAGDIDFQFNETTNVLSVAGLSAGGATFTGNISAPNIVTSVNGSTGAITNVARINEGNTFTVRQVMNAGATMASLFVGSGSTFADRIIITAGGLSASHTADTVQITSTTTGSVGLIVANNTDPANAASRTGRIQLGRSSTSGQNSTIQNTATNFTIYKGNSAGTVVLDYSSSGVTLGAALVQTSANTRITNNVLKISPDSGLQATGTSSQLIFDVTDASSTIFTSTLQGNTAQINHTTHTLPAVSGTLINTATSIVNTVNGASGTVTITGISAANTNTNATFYPVFVDRSGGLTAVYVDAVTTPLSYNPSTGLISARTFLGTVTKGVGEGDNSVWLSPFTGGAPEVFIGDTSSTNLNLRGTLKEDSGPDSDTLFAGFMLGGASSAGVPLTIASTGGIRFAGLNDLANSPAWEYLFPTSSGVSGQVLTTNGGATLSWGNAVSGICGATGEVTLSAGSNITITRSGSTFTIASTASGGGSAVVGGTGISVVQAGNTATVSNEGVNTYDGQTGAVVTPPLLLFNLGII